MLLRMTARCSVDERTVDRDLHVVHEHSNRYPEMIIDGQQREVSTAAVESLQMVPSDHPERIPWSAAKR